MKTLNNQDLESLFKNYEYIFWDYDDTLSPTVIKKGIAYVNIFKDYLYFLYIHNTINLV